ncbi:BppU family phage baseplate upper protein [Listeria seeligeri]|uniref:BppU family phage baseplate upper protein n=1 Tax=Listeria seeligeri TaxID=1640 RepID=UPI0022EB908A|nr:BppU family phage baseplate upper protein [Listeria seeligeri]
MTIKKIGTTKLETSAYYQPIGNTGIKFWNMDSNTSILQFQITRNNIVLPLGLNNVIAYITLIASDGSHLTDTLEIIDELKGILSYQIPNDFLMHTGTVQGQVYISVNNTEETVTEAEFIFEIEDALINKITSDIKIKYIRIFDDLKKDIEKKIKKIIADIDSGDDYVTAIQNVSIDAITKINAKYDDLQTRFDNLNPSQLAKKTGDTFTGSLQFDGVPTIFQAKQNSVWWYRLTSENSTTYQQSLFPAIVSGINGAQGAGYNFKQAYLKLNNVDVETVTGSQAKADKALADAKTDASAKVVQALVDANIYTDNSSKETLVWSGSSYFLDTHIFSWDATKVKHGVLLEFSRYTPGTGVQDYGYIQYFFSKEYLVRNNNKATWVNMPGATDAAKKTIRLTPTSVSGDATNGQAPSTSYALRAVTIF